MLVTAGAWVVPVAVLVAALVLAAADVAGADVMPVAAGPPPMIRPLLADAAAVVAGAEEWVTVGDDCAAGVVAAAVVAVVEPLPLEDTVMSTEGLPEPHSAVTTYVPGETDVEIVAVPVKFSEPRLIDADPPTNAVERTPLRVEPFVGQTPRIETV